MSLRDRFGAVLESRELSSLDEKGWESLLDSLVDAALAGRVPPHKLWVYRGRHGELELHTQFSVARRRQDEDNNVTVQEIIEQGYGEVGGSEESGHFYIDDGGDITLVEVQ